ncbi:Helicase PriA essential for oriC/DnaA-independent DNA replication [hydrothermal vent metagenome]|uniref:DNA 3'-5' helicase n=1 Tax=hydrothermal vent metagenome TaxID=652676 RepID=A0A1W1EJB6_9ZZZZ
MNYYKVILFRSSAPTLTYQHSKSIEIGRVVEVPLNSTIKKAIVIESILKPTVDYKILDIKDISPKIYSSFQISIAKFISSYYFSTLSLALSIFIPYTINKTKTLFTNSSLIYPILSKNQQKAYQEIKTHQASLLFGVTGSGKTEIFISLIADTLSEGKNSILLMPEISLTPQMARRLKAYFGDMVAIWHSKLSKKKKDEILKSLEDGKIRVIAGARSALFLPIDNIGLIVVDEEHDDSYKASSKPRYNARDMALLIANRLGAKALLVSATPSLSSYYKLPVVKLDKAFIESKKRYIFKSSSNTIDKTILKSIDNNFIKSNQSILFIPTRGNFKYLYCTSCGETHKCPYCSVGMSIHIKRRVLQCHYCNFTQRIEEVCSSCGYTPLETQRIGTAEAIDIIEANIDNLVVEQLDRDTITTANKLEKALNRFDKNKSHILVGTQMISKGHDYPNVTLGIITGLDYMLSIPDYRASQKAMSMLFQVAGRCGRAKEGTVIVETNQKEFFSAYLDDYERFLKDELEFVRDFYPPFTSLARVLISHKYRSKAQDIMNNTLKKLENVDIEIVGYGEAPIEKVANRYRYNILLRTIKKTTLLKALNFINSNDIEIDIDPVEFS